MILFFPRTRVLRVPADACAWAVLSPPDRMARRRSALLFEFERWLPRPIECYCCSFHTLSDGRIVACGHDRESVAALADDYDSVIPDTIPDFLADEGLLTDQFELATHDATPSRVRAAVRSVVGLAVVVSILTSVALTTGMVRRSALLEAETQLLADAVDDTYRKALPSEVSGSQPRSVLVRGLLREARQLNRADNHEHTDAALAGSELLSVWDESLGARVHRLSIRRGTASLDVSLSADPQRLLAALELLPDWAIGSPTVRRVGLEHRVGVSLDRSSPLTGRGTLP